MRLDGLELHPRPTATEAAAVQLALMRAGLADDVRPDPYASAWRTAGLRESAGYDGAFGMNAERGRPAEVPGADT